MLYRVRYGSQSFRQYFYTWNAAVAFMEECLRGKYNSVSVTVIERTNPWK